MKTFYALVLMCFVGAPLLAQQSQPAQQHEATALTTQVEFTTPIATGANGGGTNLDTLMDCMKHSTGFGVYTFAPDPNNPQMVEPVTGTNSLYMMLGQRFSFSGTGDVAGLLVGYGQKRINGNMDTLITIIGRLEAQGTGQTMTPTGMEFFTCGGIDTSSSQLHFTSIMFSEPAPLNSNFVAMIQTRSFSADDPTDQMSIFSNRHGDGQGARRAFYVTMDTAGNMVAGDLASIFNVSGQPIDIDPVIVPIVALSSSAGVSSQATLDGLTLRGAFPNPASNATTIELSLDKASNVEISLVDMNGAVVRTITQDNMEAGNHRVALSLDGIANGTYLYTVTTNRSQLAGKVTVAK